MRENETMNRTARLKLAAKSAGVSVRTIQMADRVRREGVPELLALVAGGELAIAPAHEVCVLHRDDQQWLVDQGPGMVKTIAAQICADRKGAKTLEAAKKLWAGMSQDDRAAFNQWRDKGMTP